MTAAADLPAWVYDVVMELQRWENEHPMLFAQGTRDEYVKASDCGCKALALVPVDVKQRARAIEGYVRPRQEMMGA